MPNASIVTAKMVKSGFVRQKRRASRQIMKNKILLRSSRGVRAQDSNREQRRPSQEHFGYFFGGWPGGAREQV